VLAQPKRFALLAYLASSASRGRCRRDTLLGLFWHELDRDHARKALRQSLYAIRRSLGPHVLTGKGDELVGVSSERLWCDVVAFEEGIEGGRLEEALELYGGPLLDGFHLPEAPAFERWLEAERRRIRLRAVEAAWQHVERKEAAADTRSARRWAERALAWAPYDETVFRRYVELLARHGDRSGAVRAYDAFVRQLEEDLDLGPAQETVALMESVRTGGVDTVASEDGSTEESVKAPEAPPRPPPAGSERGSVPEDPDSSPRRRWGRRLTRARVLALAAAVSAVALGVLGGRSLLGNGGGTPGPPGAAAGEAGDGVAVLPFRVRGEDMTFWREAMVDLLSTGLDGAGGLRAIDSRTLLARWREHAGPEHDPDLPVALRAAGATGARYAVVGSAVGVDPAVRLSAEVYDLVEGERLGEAQVQGEPDAILELADALSIEILRLLLRSGEGDPPTVEIASATTPSVLALKAFLAGERQFRSSEFRAGIGSYERAVALDSAFALAHYRLSVAWGWYDEPGGNTEEAIERAVRHAGRLTERDGLLVRMYRELIAGRVEFIPSLEQAVRRYPDDVEMWYLLGEAYFHLGGQALRDAREHVRYFRHAADLDPGFSPAFIHLLHAAFGNDPDSARLARRIEEYAGLTSGASGQVRSFRLAFSVAYGDSATRARALTSVDTVSLAVHATVVLLHFHHPRYLDDAAALLAAARRARSPRASRRAAEGLYLLRLRLGRPGHALEMIHAPELADRRRRLLYETHMRGFPVPAALREQVFGEMPPAGATDGEVFFAGAYAAETGDGRRVRTAASRLDARADEYAAAGELEAARRVGAAGEALRAYLAAKTGARAPALEALIAVQTRGTHLLDSDGINKWIRWWLADLLEQEGRLGESLRYYRSLGPWTTESEVPLLAYERMGRILERLGEREAARDAYQTFVFAWRDAEPGVRERVAAAGRRLEALAVE